MDRSIAPRTVRTTSIWLSFVSTVSTPGEIWRGYAESTTSIQLRWPSRGMVSANLVRQTGSVRDVVCAGANAASRITAKRVLSIGSARPTADVLPNPGQRCNGRMAGHPLFAMNLSQVFAVGQLFLLGLEKFYAFGKREIVGHALEVAEGFVRYHAEGLE